MTEAYREILPHFTYQAGIPPESTRAMSPADVRAHLSWWAREQDRRRRELAEQQ